MRLREPLLTDAALAAVLLVALELETFTTGVTTPRALAAATCAAMALALAARRIAPLPSVLVVMAAIAVLGGFDDSPQPPQLVLVVLLVSAYSAGAHLATRQARIALGVTIAALAIMEIGDVIILGSLSAAAWAAGRVARSRRKLVEQVSAQAGVAIAEERARIARELHDVVAHAVSTMTVQAGAERLALGDERPQTREALAAIERTGRQALVEMRRLVGMLRRDDEDLVLAPQPSLAQLPALAEQMRGAGLPVALTVEGDPADVPPGVDVSLYRIVQEALTNTLRHAGRAQAQVVVRYRGDAVEVEVSDDGAGGMPNGTGHGLVGMRERVTLYGGELEAGERPGGGFAVRARLPLESQP